MRSKTFTLLLAAAGIAAYPYFKRMRSQASTAGVGRVRLSGRQSGLNTGARGRLNESDMDYETPQAGFAGSANTAESLRERDVVHSPVRAFNGSEELFGSSSQRGEKPVAAGLPDLTRGA